MFTTPQTRTESKPTLADNCVTGTVATTIVFYMEIFTNQINTKWCIVGEMINLISGSATKEPAQSMCAATEC